MFLRHTFYCSCKQLNTSLQNLKLMLLSLNIMLRASGLKICHVFAATKYSKLFRCREAKHLLNPLQTAKQGINAFTLWAGLKPTVQL